MITAATVQAELIGNLRIQPLTPFLVRIEQESPAGFEDRNTFTVVNRRFEAPDYEVAQKGDRTLLSTPYYRISVPTNASSFESVRIETSNGKLLRKLAQKDLQRSFMPSPSGLPMVWVLADHPRVVPPAWGALPPPAEVDDPHSGWDMTNNAPDLYVFFPAASGYDKFREDFIALTGPVPMLPLYAFGLWYSRYHAYTEDTALEVIDKFRSRKIPLDVFVADTDWRVGASHGYGVNTNLFPDMRRFIARAHEKHIRLMYNDHPEPVGDHAFDPKELRYRYDGLTSLLDMGADVWWFDRNWHTHLHSPAEGLNKEVWGMRLYSDVTRSVRPKKRALIMSNVDGINNGHLAHPSHPAAHRFPVWWTGDTNGEWEYLRLGVQNGVDCGIHSLLPYVNEDLGAHHGQPNDEFYTRFMQFGVFSPITRIHSSNYCVRYPWYYPEAIEKIVGNYFRLRYRLLPMIYTAAYRAYRDGTPLLRRCDLEWPQHSQATDNTQYLFGDDLLVAPIIAPANSNEAASRLVWIPGGEWEDAWSGERHIGPKTIPVSTELHQYPVFIRCGGIVINTPQRLYTEGFRWDDLIVDAYASSENGTTVRGMYEDDGSTTIYTNGAFGLTRLELARAEGRVTLNITPSTEHSVFQTDKRNWLIRLHHPVGTECRSVSLNGKAVEPEGFTVIPAADDVPDQMFTGEHSAPGPKSGPVIEIPMHQVPAANNVTIALVII